MAQLDQIIEKESPPLFWLQGFDGMNCRDDRSAIEDQELYWLENFVPIGKGNLRTQYDNDDALYTTTGGLTIVHHFGYNIGTNYYFILFLSDGSAVQVQVPSGSVTTVASAGTFTISPSTPDANQWGTTGIIIVSLDTDGVWVWDGTTLFAAGELAPSWVTGMDDIVVTGDTNTSTSITNVSSTTDVIAGMGITGTDIPAGTTIISKTVNTLTLSQAASASNAGLTFTIQWPIPSGLGGTAVEIYQNRTWIINGNLLQFSAPANGILFATSSGGGATPSTDGELRVSYIGLQQSNGFLYLFGDSSIYAVSNVQTSGSPATTTFTNQQIDNQNGLGWRDALTAFGRAILFANPTGVYILFGGAAEKMSDKIDGLFENADFVAVPPSMSTVSCFGQRNAVLMINTLDLSTDTQRTIFALWKGKQWYVASQTLPANAVSTVFVNSVPQTWATDGSNLFKTFTKPSPTLTKKLLTKLWAGRSNIVFKNAMRVYGEFSDIADTGVDFSGTIDSDRHNPISFVLTQSFIWVNDAFQEIVWLNNLSQPLDWISQPSGIQGTDTDQSGLLLGLTVETESEDFRIVGCGVSYNEQTIFG